ncbi:hypothetical protein JTE90_029140 [Oedothorax gibbosus]|uniref:Uncharacterized protein n=1 Tax=Oedothorax gibbosus TaxID=931172 RepID=A0AAV6UIK0_9ARAC|nr:hypothetical protein JTE90_029140 [Oedothorax gibbosus]
MVKQQPNWFECDKEKVRKITLSIGILNKMNVQYISVVVEQAFEHGLPSMPLFKLRAPGTITMLQFLDKIRARLKLPPIQAVYFVLAEGLPVGMNQTLKNVYQNNRSKKGLLHLACISENTFGCHPPLKKPIKSKFPGAEALPFGAPEPIPAPGFQDIFEILQAPSPMWPQDYDGSLTEPQLDWVQSFENSVLQEQHNQPWQNIFTLPFQVIQQGVFTFASGQLLSGDVSETSSDEEFNNIPDHLPQIAAEQSLHAPESDLTSEEEEMLALFQ